jgi:hypothetical protein
MNKQVVVPMPAAVERVSCSYPAEPQPRGSQTWDWQEKQRRLVWKFKKVPGGSEHTIQVQSPSLVCIVSSRCNWRHFEVNSSAIADLGSSLVLDQVSSIAGQPWADITAKPLSVFTGAPHDGRRAPGAAPGHWPHQPGVHGADAVRITAASAVPADHEARKAGAAGCVPLGAVCDYF